MHTPSSSKMPDKHGTRTTGETRPGAQIPGEPRWKKGQQIYADFVRAIDGDTILVSYWVGSYLWPNTNRVRLSGIDAPELYPHAQPGAEAARQHLASLCASRTICVIPTRAWPDKYGRLLARVYNNAMQDINHHMIADGYARPYRAKAKRRPHERKDTAITPHAR